MKLNLVIRVAILSLGCLGSAAATSFSVVNFSFESPALAGPNAFTNSLPTGWSGVTSSQIGVYWPTPADMPAPADGNQVAYIFGTGFLYQDLGVAVQSGVNYELDVWIGMQAGFPLNYTLELLAGSTPFASLSGSRSVTGAMTLATLTGAGAGTGNLGVKLISTGGQPLFDNVQVQSLDSAAPEPASVAFISLGLGALAWRRTRCHAWRHTAPRN